MDEGRDIAIVLADYVARIRYQDLPAQIVVAAKKDVLDQLGVILAGRSALGCNEVAELVKEWGGKEESTIIGRGGKGPSFWAALVNSMMGSSLDYDDCFEDEAGKPLHPGASVVPACLAIAERKGKVHGRDFITAAVVGIDVMCRMLIATKTTGVQTGWAFPPLFGYFGAAAGASKILGLSKEGIVNAFGIAYSQAAGNLQCIVDGALTKRMQPAFSASAGVLSALLAARGITGSTNTFEGRHGLYKVYLQNKYEPELATRGLGEKFLVSDLSFKPYPCCRYTHTAIDAALQLAPDIQIDDIEKVTAFVSPEQEYLCQPLEVKQKPRTIVDAQFSIPYTVATALCKRKVTLDDFTPEAIKDRQILSVAQKVIPQVDKELLSKSKFLPGLLEIRFRNGLTLRSRWVEFAKGHPNNSMSMDELAAKFKECALYSTHPLSEETVDRVIDLVSHLEELDDIAKVIALVA